MSPPKFAFLIPPAKDLLRFSRVLLSPFFRDALSGFAGIWRFLKKRVMSPAEGAGMSSNSTNAPAHLETEKALPAAAEHVQPSPSEWIEFARLFNLSPRQLEVAKLLYADCPVKCLPHRLDCASGTSNVHRMRLYQKTGVHHRTGLVREVLEFCTARRSGERLPPSS
jgi:DNA-binding CsgD family transcriptional regulator